MSGFPAAFFALTFLLSMPFYALNILAHMNVLGAPEMGALYIASFTVTPLAAASILTFRRRGMRGLKGLLARIFDFRRISDRRWYLVALLFAPLIHVLCLGGVYLRRAPVAPALAPPAALPLVLPFFIILAAGEEAGWMGYAFGPMQERRGALAAALMLGVAWALWHVPFFVFMMPDPTAFGAQVLALVGTRVLVAWVFNNTGRSVFAVTLFHAADNTALVVLPDVNAGTPWGAVLLCGLILVSAVVVAVLWGPRTLARYRIGNRT